MMPSQRRARTIAITAVVALIFILYFSSSTSAVDKTFYDRTVAALKAKNDPSQYKMGTAAVKDSKLREAAKQVKEEVVAQAEDRRKKETDGHRHGHDSSEHGAKVGHDAGNGQKVMGGLDDSAAAEEKSKLPHEVGASQSKWTNGDDQAEAVVEPEQTQEQMEVDAALTSILKRSPIIIFSKSYCPFSKKAKGIFAKYSITPAPFIVELDHHSLGPQLQDKLLDTTGRRTVPNILISGKSIGGGDDVEALHNEGKLIEKIKYMGGKRIIEAKLSD